jgi:hypothetical protein
VSIQQGDEHLTDSLNPCLNDHFTTETQTHA